MKKHAITSATRFKSLRLFQYTDDTTGVPSMTRAAKFDGL